MSTGAGFGCWTGGIVQSHTRSLRSWSRSALREHNRLSADDPWFARLRDAYLEPWGTGLRDTFDLGLRVGAVAHAIASLRQRDALPEDARHSLDPDIAWRLRHALAALQR